MAYPVDIPFKKGTPREVLNAFDADMKRRRLQIVKVHTNQETSTRVFTVDFVDRTIFEAFQEELRSHAN